MRWRWLGWCRREAAKCILARSMESSRYGVVWQASTDETNSKMLYPSCDFHVSRIFYKTPFRVQLQLTHFYKNNFVGVSYSISLNTLFGINPSIHSSSAVSLTIKKSPGFRPVADELT